MAYSKIKQPHKMLKIKGSSRNERGGGRSGRKASCAASQLCSSDPGKHIQHWGCGCLVVDKM